MKILTNTLYSILRKTTQKNLGVFMARPGVTYFEVSKAAEQLVGSGKTPTIERIRLLLGSGSNSTLGEHLRAWKLKQDETQQIASKENLPEELIAMLKGLWERVMGQAEAQIETLKNDTQENLAQYQQSLQKLQQENSHLQQSEAQLKQTNVGLSQEKIALEQMMVEAHTKIATLQTQREGLTEQLADKQTRIEELNKQNKQTQANLEHYRNASLEQRQQEQQRAEQQHREFTHALQQLKIENETLKQKEIDLQKSYEQLQLTKNNEQAEREKMVRCNERMSAELHELNTTLAQKTASEQHWQTQYAALYTKWESQMSALTALQTQNAVLSEQITTIKIELDKVSDENKILARDKWVLGQEKAQLFGQLKQAASAL